MLPSIPQLDLSSIMSNDETAEMNRSNSVKPFQRNEKLYKSMHMKRSLLVSSEGNTALDSGSVMASGLASGVASPMILTPRGANNQFITTQQTDEVVMR